MHERVFHKKSNLFHGYIIQTKPTTTIIRSACWVRCLHNKSLATYFGRTVTILVWVQPNGNKYSNSQNTRPATRISGTPNRNNAGRTMTVTFLGGPQDIRNSATHSCCKKLRTCAQTFQIRYNYSSSTQQQTSGRYCIHDRTGGSIRSVSSLRSKVTGATTRMLYFDYSLWLNTKLGTSLQLLNQLLKCLRATSFTSMECVGCGMRTPTNYEMCSTASHVLTDTLGRVEQRPAATRFAVTVHAADCIHVHDGPTQNNTCEGKQTTSA